MILIKELLNKGIMRLATISYKIKGRLRRFKWFIKLRLKKIYFNLLSR